MTVSFYTLGCKLNQCESEALASAFGGQGFFIVPLDDHPDVVVINTCTVTSKSEQKARRIIRKASRDGASSLVIVTGCYAQVDPEALEELGDNVVVVPQERKHLLFDVLNSLSELLPANAAEAKPLHESPAERFNELIGRLSKDNAAGKFSYIYKSLRFHTRPFLKIQDGCSRKCAYCRIPLARGPSVSLDPAEAVGRLKQLEDEGYGEVVITGVNISDYRCKGYNLPALLEEMVRSTKTVRIRLSSLEPDTISSDLIDIVSSKRICPHFHMPVQSGSDKILRLMRRPYTSDTIYSVVERLRKVRDDPFIAADVLIGFPGEEEEDFMATKELVVNNDFSRFHVFPFSPRPDTAAVYFDGHVKESVVKKRTTEIIAVSERQVNKYYERWIGREVSVLLETPVFAESGATQMSRGCDWQGLSENYLKVEVHRLSEEKARRGTIVPVILITDKTGIFAIASRRMIF